MLTLLWTVLNVIATIVWWGLMLLILAGMIVAVAQRFRPPRPPLTRADVERILEDTIETLEYDRTFGTEWRQFMAADFDDVDLVLAQLRCRDIDEAMFAEEIPDEDISSTREVLQEVLAKLRRSTAHVRASSDPSAL